MIAGGGAPEIELALRLAEYSQTLSGMEQYCYRAFAEALEVNIMAHSALDKVLCNLVIKAICGTMKSAIPVLESIYKLCIVSSFLQCQDY